MSYSKFKAIKTSVNGITFDSKKEANRYVELLLLQRAGIIYNLKIQVPYILIEKSANGRAIKYIADFVYIEDEQTIVEDVKGFKTDVYKLKKRMFEEKYKIKIKET